MHVETFAKTKFSYGAAIATILLLMALAVVLAYLYWSYRGEKNEEKFSFSKSIMYLLLIFLAYISSQ